MKNLKLTVSIGIPAHNEEKNIGNILNQILEQNTSNFILEKIVVILDGCSDNTEKIVLNLAKTHPIIQIINDGKRKGQTERLNDLHKLINSEIFVGLDADISLASKNTLVELIDPFYHTDTSLVGGNDLPESGNTIVGRAVVARINLWLASCRTINNGKTIHNHPGRINASRKSLYKNFIFPKIAIANDDYRYLINKKMGNTFAFAKNAKVFYKVPDNIKDFLSQFSRFKLTEGILAEEFGDLAIREYAIPLRSKLNAFISLILTDPISMLVSLFLQIYLLIYIRVTRNIFANGYWDKVRSTQ